MLKIVFFGTPKIALKSLDYLNNSSGIEIVAIVTQPDKPVGRGHKLQFPPLKEYGIEHKIPVFQPKMIRKDSEILNELRKLEPDFFVTFAFGQILSQEVLDIPKYETINLHASLLPKYRGANPIQRAIINGDKETGICTMITELGLDCGDVCMKLPIEISDDMTCVDLFNEISERSPELLKHTLLGLANNTITPTKQCEDGVCMAPKMTKEEALINWNNSAKDIHNLVRGIYCMPSAYFLHNDKVVKVMKTRVIDCECKNNNCGDFLNVTKEGIEIKCAQGIILLERVKPEGKGEMHARDWYNGLKSNQKG